MTRTIAVGLDGSPESAAAARWAAREAVLRGVPLEIVCVREPEPALAARAPLLGAETRREREGGSPRDTADTLRDSHPGLVVLTDRLTGTADDTLIDLSGSVALLVLGSRGLGGIGGHLLGSVALAVVAHATCPVVAVRAAAHASGDHTPDDSGRPSAATPSRPVVAGIDAADPSHDPVLRFAFEEARLRGAPLRVVHGWSEPFPPGYRFHGDADVHAMLLRRQAAVLARTLHPWRQRFPDVRVIEASRCGSAAQVLVAASREAALTVVGRRTRTAPLGPHLGHVTHAAPHHVTAPVAVVPHD
ncbi:universal stress protein [Streptomyces sp. ACT015]|uniref:universal stress protein n=1 Tax=Streptomyces sp. ACT015 TaxID=3134807 RepID=UPI003D183500